MKEKPPHLTGAYAAQFADGCVAAAYRARPPYPPELFSILESLLPGGERNVLELGCGTGDLTLGLAALVDRLDAVEPAAAMLQIARERPGSTPAIRWIESSAETFAYAGPYAMVVAAESLHWMDWRVVLPAIAAALGPGAQLALVVGRVLERLPWDAPLSDLVRRHSTNRDYRPYDIVTELSERGLFHERGRKVTRPIGFSQPVADYIESFHSRNGFSRERMGAERADAFDAELGALIASHCAQGVVEAQLSSTVVWGQPARSATRDR